MVNEILLQRVERASNFSQDLRFFKVIFIKVFFQLFIVCKVLWLISQTLIPKCLRLHVIIKYTWALGSV